MPMPKKTQIALNRGRRKAGLKPIRFGAKKKSSSVSFAAFYRYGDRSEECYARRLREKLGEKSLVFKTGKAKGVPDIVAFSHGKISFYEIKPGGARGGRYESDNLDQFLKKTQEKWIRENCLERKNKAYIVFYLRFGSKRPRFTYYSKQLTEQNLKKYCQTSPKSTRIATLKKQQKDYDSGKICFT